MQHEQIVRKGTLRNLESDHSSYSYEILITTGY